MQRRHTPGWPARATPGGFRDRPHTATCPARCQGDPMSRPTFPHNATQTGITRLAVRGSRKF